MNQKTSASDKQRKVSALRDSPQTSVKKPKNGSCADVVAVTNGKGKNLVGSEGVGVADHSNHRPKPVMRNFNPPRESKIKLVSSEESEKLLASQSSRRNAPVKIQKKLLLVNALMKKKDSNADASRPRENARKPTQHTDEIRSDQHGLVRVPKGRVIAAVKNHPIQRVEQEPADQDQDHDDVVAVPEPNGREGEIRNGDYDYTAREKVLEVLRFFKEVYIQLDREKEERRGGDFFIATSRVDIKTLDVIEKMRKRVNVEKRIGSVPGINVGDAFQYKTQLRAVGLHSKPMCGIDYMEVGDIKLATSVVASEGYGYNDKFDSDVVVYIGEGGNVISKENKTEDQKLTKGNLALANSMRHKKEVRVIRGEERCDRRGKHYIYFGLYLVENYWAEIEGRGKVVYKFELCRIPGQPPLT